jgi:hypothetical protein
VRRSPWFFFFAGLSALFGVPGLVGLVQGEWEAAVIGGGGSALYAWCAWLFSVRRLRRR